MRLLAFVLGHWIFIPYSYIVKMFLTIKKIKVGKNFYIQGVPYLKINGNPRDIIIGDNVRINGDIDLRNREKGKIVLNDGCKIDHGVRIVAANNATVSIGKNTNIGCYSIMNCGENVTIGQKCLISGFVYIQSSNHGMRKGAFIKDQDQSYAPISIGDDVWLGSHVSILAGVKIGNGAVVGSKSVVTKSISPNQIVAGVPAKVISQRE